MPLTYKIERKKSNSTSRPYNVIVTHLAITDICILTDSLVHKQTININPRTQSCNWDHEIRVSHMRCTDITDKDLNLFLEIHHQNNWQTILLFILALHKEKSENKMCI